MGPENAENGAASAPYHQAAGEDAKPVAGTSFQFLGPTTSATSKQNNFGNLHARLAGLETTAAHPQTHALNAMHHLTLREGPALLAS